MEMISVFTDGSCNTAFKTGAWAAIIFAGGKKIILSGTEHETTHQRMELLAAIRAIEFVLTMELVDPVITIYTDSQYLVGIPRRKDQLVASGMTTRNKLSVRNADLLNRIFSFLDILSLRIMKVKAHEKISSEGNSNREVDKLVRKVLRLSVRDFREKPR